MKPLYITLACAALFILPDAIGFIRYAIVIVSACGSNTSCFEGLLGG
jgi:hypothetical protein